MNRTFLLSWISASLLQRIVLSILLLGRTSYLFEVVLALSSRNRTFPVILGGKILLLWIVPFFRLDRTFSLLGGHGFLFEHQSRHFSVDGSCLLDGPQYGMF